jgi:hypothetical protein
MHNRALHDTLAAFVEEAAWQLAEEISGGAEIPFELVEQGRASAPLYCYQPLTGRFLAERSASLTRLPSYTAAMQQISTLPDLTGYLAARGRRIPSGDPRAQADAAVQAFLTAVWEDATDFVYDPERFDAAFRQLEELVYDGRALSVVIAPVDGLVIESAEVNLGEGMSLMRASAVKDSPPDMASDPYATVIVLRSDEARDEGARLAEAGRRLRRMQSSLRLWDDAEPLLGPAAWARTDGGPWHAIPLATGIRRMDGDCLLTAEEEDPLRAFCSLIARRTPRSGPLAWALRRFELGCERPLSLEALTDWSLAARALFGEEQTWARLGAICATPEERLQLTARLVEAAGLERVAISGLARPEEGVEALVAELGSCLRAVLRDVLCGHLDPDVRAVADAVLADAEQMSPHVG